MLFFDILLGIVSLAITGVVTIAILWVSIYMVLDIISRLKNIGKMTTIGELIFRLLI